MGAVIKPPFSWLGAKWRIAKGIVALLPEHTRYLELFGGSAAVLLTKRAVKFEAFNDLNSEIVNTFRVLRDQADELTRVVSLTPFSREEYERAFEQCEEPVERARRFIVRVCQGYAPIERHQSWRVQVGTQRWENVPAWWQKLPLRFDAVAKRLKDVFVEHRDWRDCMSGYDRPDILVYADPPYPDSTRSNSVGEYKEEIGSAAGHAELLDALCRFSGMVVLSGYDCPQYREALADWDRVELKQRVLTGAARIECVWRNQLAMEHATKQLDLFGDGS
jgi:DNA adenine methylase